MTTLTPGAAALAHCVSFRLSMREPSTTKDDNTYTTWIPYPNPGWYGSSPPPDRLFPPLGPYSSSRATRCSICAARGFSPLRRLQSVQQRHLPPKARADGQFSHGLNWAGTLTLKRFFPTTFPPSFDLTSAAVLHLVALTLDCTFMDEADDDALPPC